MSKDSTQSEIRCPRCGYELRGIIESWSESCPMEGICAECGLEFEWGELLCERRAVPRWCVEYARGWGVCGAMMKTSFILLLRPRKFWRDLKMTHVPQWGRIVLIVCVIAFMLYPIFAGSVGWQVYKNSPRAAGFGATGILQSPARAGIWAAILPFSKKTNRRGRLPRWRRWDDTIPANVSSSLNIPFSRQSLKLLSGSSKFYELHSYQILLLTTMHFMIVAAFSSVSFVMLPVSIRKARVRWVHLLRIQLYSLPLQVVPLAAFVLLSLTHYRLPFLSREGFAYLVWVTTFALFVTWWSLASRYYLKLPHAWGVGVCMVVLAYASGLFLVAMIDYLMI